MKDSIHDFDLHEEKKKKKLLMDYQDIYFDIYESRLKHDIKELENFLILEDGIYKKKGEIHCLEECCQFIMSHFLHFVPKHRPVLEKKQEVTRVVLHAAEDDYKLQVPQLIDDYQLFDYVFDKTQREIKKIKYKGHTYVCDIMDEKILDCFYSTQDVNISRKPFHVRRDHVSMLPVGLKMIGGTATNLLYVVDAMTYEQGKMGGYYEYMSVPVIFVKKKKIEGRYRYCVKGSLATSSKWTAIAEDLNGDTEPNKYYAYDYKLRKEVYLVDYSHTIFDWEVVKKRNYKNSMKDTFKKNVCEGNYQLVDVEMSIAGKVTGVGFRKNVFDISLGWPVMGTLCNDRDQVKIVFSIPCSHYDNYRVMIESYCVKRGVRVIIHRKHVREKKIYVERWGLKIGQDIT